MSHDTTMAKDTKQKKKVLIVGAGAAGTSIP